MKKLIAIAKLTTSCPGNCKGCVTRQEWFAKKCGNRTVMSLQMFKMLCDEVQRLEGKYICLSGGEPTILPNLEEYIAIAKASGLIVRLNTNGWLVTYENLKKWVNAGLNQIVLSVYGLAYDEVLQLRGNGEIYTRCVQALDAVSKLKNESPSSFLSFFQTIIMYDNYMKIPQLFETAMQKSFDVFWPSYLEDAFECDSEIMRPEDIKKFQAICVPKMYEIAKSFIREPAILSQVNTQLKKYYAESFYEGGIYHKKNYVCSLVGQYVYVYPNGVVYPCPGHEYFVSDCCVDLSKGDKLSEIYKFCNSKFDFCQYCAQGKHIGINLSSEYIDEHS